MRRAGTSALEASASSSLGPTRKSSAASLNVSTSGPGVEGEAASTAVTEQTTNPTKKKAATSRRNAGCCAMCLAMVLPRQFWQHDERIAYRQQFAGGHDLGLGWASHRQGQRCFAFRHT